MTIGKSLIRGLLLSATVALATPAFAAVNLTSAQVTGPTGTIWNTFANSANYILGVSKGFSGALNNPRAIDTPIDLASDNGFTVAGDGWPTSTKHFTAGSDSDPYYNLALTLSDGTSTITLTGTYFDTTGIFTAGPSEVLDGNTYSLSSFAFDRQNSNFIGAQSITNTSYDKAHSPGSGFDYLGSFNVSAVPEPATWAMMVGGFGLLGASMRRRRTTTATVFA